MDSASRATLPRRFVLLGLRRPKLTLAVWAIAIFAATPFVLQLSIETSTESVLDRSDPAWAFYQRAQALFGGDEVLVVMLQSQEPFDPTVLRQLVQTTADLEDTPGARRVDSLATVPLIEVTPDGGLSLAAALEDGVPSSASSLDDLSRRILADPIAPYVLLSDDGRSFAINIFLEQDADAHYRAILARIDEVIGDAAVAVSGVPIFRLEASRRTQTDLLRFVPITVAGIGILLFCLFGSLRAALIPLFCSGAASWIVMALMGGLGRPLTITTVIVPSLLLAIGCAYGIHLISASAENHRDAWTQLLNVAPPIALSGLTTTIGFLSTSLVQIDAIHDIGLFGAVGVLVVLVATLTIGPASMVLHPFEIRRSRFQDWLARDVAPSVVQMVSRWRSLVLVAWLVVATMIGAGLIQLKVETDAVLWFPKENPVRAAYNVIRSELSGISPMNVIIEAQDGRRVTDPEAVDLLNRLTRYLGQLPQVGKALSIADLLQEMHRGFAGDPKADVPHEVALIEQYLLLLESEPQVHDLITMDRRLANILLRVDENGSQALLSVDRAAKAWWDREGSADYELRTTGIMYEFARAQNEISMGQVRGLIFALAAVTVILMVVFRSPRLAIIGLIPNVIPILMTFGAMGLVGIPLDAGTVLLGSMAFGIAVDDTIHTLVRFEQGRSKMAPAQALVAAYQAVLPALVFTSVLVAFGFAVLAASDFLFTQRLGLLTAGAMLLCLLANVLMLPTLLVSRCPRCRRRHRPSSLDEQTRSVVGGDCQED